MTDTKMKEENTSFLKVRYQNLGLINLHFNHSEVIKLEGHEPDSNYVTVGCFFFHQQILKSKWQIYLEFCLHSNVNFQFNLKNKI